VSFFRLSLRVELTLPFAESDFSTALQESNSCEEEVALATASDDEEGAEESDDDGPPPLVGSPNVGQLGRSDAVAEMLTVIGMMVQGDDGPTRGVDEICAGYSCSQAEPEEHLVV
jgi:hypothetical protein